MATRYVEPGASNTPGANHQFMVVLVKKGGSMSIDKDRQTALYVLNGRGKMSNAAGETHTEKGDAAFLHGFKTTLRNGAESPLEVAVTSMIPAKKFDPAWDVRHLAEIDDVIPAGHVGFSYKPIISPGTSADFVFGLLTVKQGGFIITYDLHPEQHTFYWLKGAVNIDTRLKIHPMKEQDAIWINHWTPHIWRAEEYSEALFFKG
jgi:quercetin dioxygenase-like cupin family protein